MSFSNFYYIRIIILWIITGPRGATVARLTPDQKVACSNHVGVNFYFQFALQLLDPESDYVKSIFFMALTGTCLTEHSTGLFYSEIPQC